MNASIVALVNQRSFFGRMMRLCHYLVDSPFPARGTHEAVGGHVGEGFWAACSRLWLELVLLPALAISLFRDFTDVSLVRPYHPGVRVWAGYGGFGI